MRQILYFLYAASNLLAIISMLSHEEFYFALILFFNLVFIISIMYTTSEIKEIKRKVELNKAKSKR